MAALVHFDFKYDGPFGQEMARAYGDLAVSITEEPGFLWKIWTENEATREAGGRLPFQGRSFGPSLREQAHTAAGVVRDRGRPCKGVSRQRRSDTDDARAAADVRMDQSDSSGRSIAPRFWRNSATSQHSRAQIKPKLQPARTSVG